MINLISVDIRDSLYSREALKLRNGANTDNLSPSLRGSIVSKNKTPHLFKIFAYPQRDGCAPISITRDVPVPGISQPIPKPVVANILWHPSDLL